MTLGPQTDNQEEFSLEDLEKLQPIFIWFFIALQFALMGTLIWAGLTNKSSLIVIIVGGMAWLGVKLLKSMISNQFKTLIPIAKKNEFIKSEFETRAFDDDGSDINVRAEIMINDNEDVIEDSLHNVKLTPKLGLVAILFGAFLPAAFWYGLGIGMSKLFS